MNNSYLAIEQNTLVLEKPIENKEFLRKREGELIKILDAIKDIEQWESWSTLKKLVFDGLVQILEREMRDEARKEQPDTLKLNRLAGQLKWAEKYADLNKLYNVFRLELTNIRKKIKE